MNYSIKSAKKFYIFNYLLLAILLMQNVLIKDFDCFPVGQNLMYFLHTCLRNTLHFVEKSNKML